MMQKAQLRSLFVSVITLVAAMMLINPARAQNNNATNILNKIETYQGKLPSEKLYLQFDKPNYFAGDTIWYKAYLVNARNRKATDNSGKLYVELVNDSSRVMDRMVIQLTAGLGEGDFTLDPETIRDGAYTIRAYTNWMQNFGEDAYFHKRIYIGNSGQRNNWLISEQHTVKATPKGKNIQLALQLTDVKNLPVVNDEVEIQLTNGNKQLFRKRISTTVEGRMSAEMLLPAGTDTRNLYLVLQGVTNKRIRQKFPFFPGGEGQNIDVQFLPEGGEIVAGLLNKIAFKALGEDGLATAISGTIIDSKNTEVVAFNTMHNGMGYFRMIPQSNEVYKAQIKTATGELRMVPLPIAKAGGTTMRIDNVSSPDTVRIYLSATADVVAANKAYTLIAQSKDTVQFGLDVKFDKGYYNLGIPNEKFNTGIVNFSLLDDKSRPVNERKIFIDHHDRLTIAVISSKQTYRPKDSVAIDVTVTDANGKPVMGSFALAVTEDVQVKQPNHGDNILTNLLLSSELKGSIQDPGWYFAAENTDAPRALDNLLLTQGWTGFNWANLSEKTKDPEFMAESDNRITGKLINFLHKPVVGAKVTLMSKSTNETMISDTVSNKEGRFVFDKLPWMDSVNYTVNVHTKKGSSFGGGLIVDEIKRPPAMPMSAHRLIPWFANTDNTLLNYYAKTQANKQATDNLLLGDVKGRLLNNVTIKAKRKTSLRGNGGEVINYYDALLDEKALTKIGRITLLDYLERSLYGFNAQSFYHGSKNDLYVMDGNILADIIIDGVSVTQFYSPGPEHNGLFNHFTSYLTSITAADVKELVIYHTYINDERYVSFLVIKTRSGNGPAARSSQGIYVYRPAPVYKGRQFYTPKYKANIAYDNAMSRSTIHWEPNVITGKNGKATISFYAADEASTYTLNIQGTDLLGGFGNQTIKIKVDDKGAN